MGFGRFLATYVFPPPELGGMRAGLYWRTLAENRFSIDPRYWARAAALGLISLGTSLGGTVEDILFSKKINAVELGPPLFILGFWRSGTTHLHNILATHPGLVAPSTYQAICPHTFLLSESVASFFLRWLIEPQRPMDNMAAGLDQPQEDEFAICAMTGISHLIGFAFDGATERYEKYLTFDGICPSEQERWIRAFRWFVKKVMLRSPNHAVVLKSPQHTCRIRYLLEAFPDARFVHIHRHPYEVYASLMHAWREVAPVLELQVASKEALEDQVVERYRTVYELFLQQRELIPPDRFFETSYARLTQRPLHVIEELACHLSLGDIEDWRPVLEEYLESVAGYRRNELPALSERLAARLSREWAATFRAFGYDP